MHALIEGLCLGASLAAVASRVLLDSLDAQSTMNKR
jgi:hypothetical protein